MKKKITLVPRGGLANRMKAVASLYFYCRGHCCDLEVVWFANRELNASFERLFLPLEGVKIRAASAIDYFTLMNPVKGNLFFPKFYRPLFFDKVIDVGAALPLAMDYSLLEPTLAPFGRIYIESCYGLYGIDGVGTLFGLQPSLAARVKKVTDRFTDRTVGVHIRRTDNLVSVRESPLVLFEEAMEREVAENAEVRFFVASDSDEDKRSLLARFGDRVVTSFEDAARNRPEGIEYALTDLYTLAATDKIYGSAGSTFTRLASELGEIPLEILTRADAGRE